MAEVDSRFLQANERTLLAWIRTGLGLGGFGFVLAKSGALLEVVDPAHTHHDSDGLNLWLGLGFVAASAVTMGVSVVRFQRVHRAIVAGEPASTSAATPIALAATTIAMMLALGAWLLIRG